MGLPLFSAAVAISTVVVNRRCNQACRFCDRRADSDGAEHSDVAVRAAIERARGDILITGGEPALRPELTSWIALAHRGGRRVILETNGTLFSYPGRAQAVARAGLGEARVALPAGDDVVAAAITRDDPGALERALAGIANLTAAGVEVTVTIPLSDPALPSLARLCERAAAAVRSPGRLRGIVAHVLRGSPLDLPAAARAVVEAAAAAARLPEGGVPFSLDPERALPPCAFAEIAPPARLLDGAIGTRAPVCEECALDGLCPGPAAVIPIAALRPLDGTAARRVAPALGDRARTATLEAVSNFHYFDETRREVLPGLTVRVAYRCNQRCPMCFVDTSLDPVPPRLWQGALDEAAAGGVRYLQISGGEPTLSPHLAAAITRASDGGIGRIELQTNAIRCADRGYTATLARAGLTDALVSLHGASDAIADAVTLAPGTAARTVVGIDALLAEGIAVQLHYVVNAVNFTEAAPFVERVLARWGTRPSLLFSFVAPMDRVPKEAALVPRMSDAAPHLRAALDRCLEAGLRFTGPGSFCGLPLCILDGDPRYYPDRHLVPAGSIASEFVHPAACDGCRERASCRGLRTAYVALHGDGEVHRI
ncbi:MAG: radical SAM protein [Myxococcales bacterium]|nr:radical SAM protein [Myxococcales bacterium]